MSWSVSAVGKPAAVAVKLEADFNNITYLKSPEDELKKAAAGLVIAAVKAYTGTSVVTVTASGHGTTSGDSSYQTIAIAVQPLYGFVE
jgi:hypothetical protein